MNWQEKLDAIQAFATSYDTALKMRAPGDWYVSCGMSIGGDGCLTGKYGNGTTPEEAVEAHWKIYTALPHDQYAVNRENKRARWNGYMWREISDDEANGLRAKASA